MSDESSELTDAEVDDLVRRALDAIGQRFQEGASRSFSNAGPRHLARHMAAEVQAIKDLVYGKNGKPPRPAARKATLAELQKQFPPT